MGMGMVGGEGGRYLLWRSPRGRWIWLGGTWWHFRGAVWQVCAEAAALIQMDGVKASLSCHLACFSTDRSDASH